VLRNPKQPRVEPVAEPRDDATAAALAELGPPIALFGVFARRPDRAHAVAQWGRYYFSRRVALTLRQRELIIDRTTALCGADYEWGIHVAAFADKAGLTDTQIDSLATGQPTDRCWSDLILITGWYHAISFAVRALRLTQEPSTPRLAR
jgi:alkylhydroperoxidase family enzyme